MTVTGKSGPSNLLSVSASALSSDVPDQILVVPLRLLTKLRTSAHRSVAITRKEQRTFLTVSKPPLSVTRENIEFKPEYGSIPEHNYKRDRHKHHPQRGAD
jgi:hypothetical protein